MDLTNLISYQEIGFHVPEICLFSKISTLICIQKSIKKSSKLTFNYETLEKIETPRCYIKLFFSPWDFLLKSCFTPHLTRHAAAVMLFFDHVTTILYLITNRLDRAESARHWSMRASRAWSLAERDPWHENLDCCTPAILHWVSGCIVKLLCGLYRNHLLAAFVRLFTRLSPPHYIVSILRKNCDLFHNY